MEKRTLLFRRRSVFAELNKNYKSKRHFWSRHLSLGAVILDTFSVISKKARALVLRGRTVQTSKDKIIFARLSYSYLINCMKKKSIGFSSILRCVYTMTR